MDLKTVRVMLLGLVKAKRVAWGKDAAWAWRYSNGVPTSVGAVAGFAGGLKKIDPARYGTLNHPGDSYSYDIFTQTGDLVRREDFARTSIGGVSGLNEWVWDGRNGDGAVVASGGYIALVEAEGIGQTLHVMRRKIAVVR